MSVDGDIDFTSTWQLDRDPQAGQIIDCKIVPEDNNLPFGKLSAGWIKIGGYLGQVYPSLPRNSSPEDPGDQVDFGPEPAASAAPLFGAFRFDTVDLEASVVTKNYGSREWHALI